MPKKKGTKDKSHLETYWRKGWRFNKINKLSKIIFPKFNIKKGCYNDDS
jgi:hypothetical protein